MALARKLVSITEISEAELAVRMCEASYQLRRPPGSTAEQALDAMEPESRNGWRRAARTAMEYWRECIEQSQRVS
jgi:hypothetical protein